VSTCFFVLIGSELSYRCISQYQSDKAMRISTANGIDEAMFVKIGGIDQWIAIRGRGRANPVLLILHGGPGGATSALARDTLSWEADFTLSDALDSYGFHSPDSA
jgi:proline iminopeptidase